MQPRADGEPLETPAPPRLDLSEEVFPEGDEPRERGPAKATDEALAETPMAEETPEAPVAEETPAAPVAEETLETPVAEPTEIPAAEPEVPVEATDASIEADTVAPEEPGPITSRVSPRGSRRG